MKIPSSKKRKNACPYRRIRMNDVELLLSDASGGSNQKPKLVRPSQGRGPIGRQSRGDPHDVDRILVIIRLFAWTLNSDDCNMLTKPSQTSGHFKEIGGALIGIPSK